MSMYGMMGDLDEDPIFGQHMRQMRQMNNMMNSLFADPFGMFGGGANMALVARQQPFFGMFQMPPPPTMNCLLNPMEMAQAHHPSPQNGMAYSSSVFSMSTGPDGTPQVYKATSSTKTGPGGVKETRKTVEDSRSGLKKMAIGHHIGERAHIIEREQNVHTGVQEENQDFINLDEEEAEDFDREFQNRARSGITARPVQLALPSNEPNTSSNDSPKNSPHHRPQNTINNHSNITPRRIRSPASSPLAMPSRSPTTSTSHSHITTSVHPHPYGSGRKNHHRPIKGPSHYR